VHIHLIHVQKKIFWKQIRMSLVLECIWHETAVFTKHKPYYLLENTVWSVAHDDWVLLWCYFKKIWKTCQYPRMNDRVRDFLSPNVGKSLQTVTLDIFIQFGVLVCSITVSVPSVQKKVIVCRNLQYHQKWRFSNNLVTKTDSMELNKRHTHLNCIMAIPVMLCYIPCIIACNVSCLFHREEWR
jgi:hypothetical protein